MKDDMNNGVGVDPGVDPGLDPQSTKQDADGLTLEEQCAEYLAGWKRALADYENVMKMQAQNRDDDRRRVRVHMAEDLLPVVDNFGYVLKHIPDPKDCPPEFQKQFHVWLQGIGHIDRQFTEALKGLGVEPIESVGKPFDPKLHEAGGVGKDEFKPDGVVLEEATKGWKVGDMVIRPAKVIVNEL